MNVEERRTGEMRLAEIMSTAMVTLAPEDRLGDAVSILADRRISGAPVMSGGEVIGVLTASDILAFEASDPRISGSDPATEWEVPTEETDEWIDGEEPVPAYFMERWDDGETSVDVRMAAPDGSGWSELAEHTVAEAMTRGILSLDADSTIDAAAEFMTRHSIHRVLVMDGARLLGIVSSSDIVRTIAGRARQEASAGEAAAIEPHTDRAGSGYVIAPTDSGSDIGFRPGGVRGLDEW